ncbi:MAG: TM0106 family RecB-like putative nuclease, partial [Solirubrobacteraceae bacterium]
MLDGHREQGRRVVEIVRGGTFAERAAATEVAMHDGADVIYQGCLQHDGWVGFPDFLIRVDEPQSALGSFSYEVHDAKLSRESRPGYVFQLLFYDRELTRVQGVRPRWMHLVLGDGVRHSYRPEEFAAYGERVRRRYLERRAELAAGTGAEVTYPYKVEHCEYCPWWKRCADRRRADDHVSLVATVNRTQAIRLDAAEVHTVGALAELPAGAPVPKLSHETLAGMRLQAALQLESRRLPRPRHVLLEPEHGHGLHRLPRPSDGDLFFDFEGDPWWGDEGLEYLFGTVYLEEGAWRYDARWATTRAEEKATFEAWIDWVMARLERHPDLHVFHYNAYEPTAVKRLAARHATREAEVDELLRRHVFVDLYGIVRQGLRIGVESYGLKGLEPVHGFERTADRGSLRGWSEFLESGDRSLLDTIAAYNEEDCRSTQSLLGWLLERRADAERQYGVVLDELAPQAPEPPSDRMQRYLDRLERLREPLTGDLPDNEHDDDADQRARRLLFDLLGYHRREAKPAWWEYFARIERTDEQLRDEDAEAIGDLTLVAGTRREDVARSYV